MIANYVVEVHEQNTGEGEHGWDQQVVRRERGSGRDRRFESEV